jgi:hypothetical protein
VGEFEPANTRVNLTRKMTFEELKGSRQAWIKLQDGGEPDRIVELSFKAGHYPARTMKSIIRQSGIVEKDWIEWAGS